MSDPEESPPPEYSGEPPVDSEPTLTSYEIVVRGEKVQVKEYKLSADAIKMLAQSRATAKIERKWAELAERPQRIEHPPATRYISILKSLLTHNAYAKIIAPYVAQEQHEYYEALLHKNPHQAKVIRIRMYLLLTWLSLRAFVSPVIRLITG